MAYFWEEDEQDEQPTTYTGVDYDTILRASQGGGTTSSWDVGAANFKGGYGNFLSKYGPHLFGDNIPQEVIDYGIELDAKAEEERNSYVSEYAKYNNDITQVPWNEMPGFIGEKVAENGYLMSLQAGGAWTAGKLMKSPSTKMRGVGAILAAITVAMPTPIIIDEVINKHASELGINPDDMTDDQVTNGIITGLENVALESLVPMSFMRGVKLPDIKSGGDLFKYLTKAQKHSVATQIWDSIKYGTKGALSEGATEMLETINAQRTSATGLGGLDSGEVITSGVVGTAAGVPMSTPSAISQGRAHNQFIKQGEQYLNLQDKQAKLDASDKYEQSIRKAETKYDKQYQDLLKSYVGPASEDGELSIDTSGIDIDYDALDFKPKLYNLPKSEPGKLSLLGKGLNKLGLAKSTKEFEDMFDKAETARDVNIIRRGLFSKFGEVESGSGEKGYGASFNTERHTAVGSTTKVFNRIHRKWASSVPGAGDFLSNVPKVIDDYVGAVIEQKDIAKYRALLMNSRFRNKVSEITDDAELLKDELDNTHNLLVDNGIKLGKQKNYKPRAYDRIAIKNNKDEFIQSLRDDVRIPAEVLNEIGEDGVSLGERMWLDMVNGKDPDIMSSEQIKTNTTAGKGGGKKGFEYHRGHRFDKLNDKFLETSTFGGLQDYFISAATRAASAKVFGAKGEKLHKSVNEALQRKLMTPSQAQKVWNMYDAEHHLYNRPTTPEGITAHQAMKVGTSIAAATYLGLAPISSITEPAWISGRVGVANMLKATPTVAAHVLKGLGRTLFTGRVGKEADMSFGRRLINALGMATNPREAEKLQKMFAGDKNVYLNAYFRGPAGLFLTQYTNFVRVWTATAGLKMIQSHANRINKLKGHKLAGWKNELRENGMSVDDFKQMTRLAPKGKIDILNDKYMDTRFTKTDGTEVSIKDLLLPWVRKITTDIALEPGVGNRPLWMSDPNLQLISQLKSFPILFGNTIMKRTMRQINPKVCTPTVVAGVGAIGSAATALALAAMALAIKDAIKDVDTERGPLDLIAGVGVPYLGSDSFGQLTSIPALSVLDKFWDAAWGEPGDLSDETFELLLRSTLGAIFAEAVINE